ncbi:PfkB family carbohydrate kinase [Dongia deserti]|uniref:PfkB family carbohydrate kinase n=1 Tax=Dongia deserti TaxID=2268030 RepID=UPI0013C44A31|nr:PfkB family carbohydrate kinase [Dongia deserti]
MTERERQILALLRGDPTLSAAAIARRLKTSAAAVTVHLSNLRQQGEIIGRGYVLKPAGQVVVIGGANMDFKCRAKAPMVLRTSNPGHMTATVGGVACNIARNLARLGVPTALFSVVGQDEFGERILREARAAGLDVSMTLMSAKPTGTYVALLDRDGDLTAAISAMELMEELTPQRISARGAALTQARMVVADCNLEQAALLRLAELCAGAKVPLAIDTVSTRKAERLRPLLKARLPIHLLALNRDEAAILAGGKVRSDADLNRAARVLHQVNVTHVLIGLSDRGTYASSIDVAARVAPFPATVADVTGGGDAALAGAIHALLNQQTLVEAARWGQAAAALTVSVAETVSPAFSPSALQTMLKRRARRTNRKDQAA